MIAVVTGDAYRFSKHCINNYAEMLSSKSENVRGTIHPKHARARQINPEIGGE